MQFDPSANGAPVSAEEARRWVSMVGIAMDPGARREARQTVEMTVAESVLRDLGSLTRIPSPERPDSLPADDQQLLDKLRFVRDSVRATDADRATVRSFADWRYAVFVAESLNAGRVEVLLAAIRTLRAMAAEYPAHAADADKLFSFARAEWGIRSEPAKNDAARVASWVAQDLVALPSCLRDPEKCGWNASGGSSRAYRRAGDEPQKLGAAFSPSARRSWHDDYSDE